MKIIDRITGKEERKRLETLVSIQEKALSEERANFESSMAMLQNLGHEVQSLKEANEVWNTIYGVSGVGGIVDRRALLPEQVRRLREASNQTYYETPEGKAIIKNLMNYIIGKGVQFTAQDSNPEVQRFIEDFAKAPKVRFSRRQFSIINRTLREGELFVHVLTDNAGRTYALRFYRPFEISGIKKESGDAETVTEYERTYSDPVRGNVVEKIPAEEIHHIKWDVDEDVDRGRPLLEPVLRRITQYGKWLDDRVKTNAAKNEIYLDVSVEGGPDQVAKVMNSIPTSGKPAFQGDSVATQAPRAGTRWVHSKSVVANWVSPQINANDCKEDGRHIRLSIAAGVQMPEFILTSDASNSNYASTLVAESPFVKAIESDQTFFEEHFKAIFGIVIRKGIEGGLLPRTSTETVLKEAAVKGLLLLKAMKETATEPDLKNKLDERISKTVQDESQYEDRVIETKTEVDFSWPSIVSRDIWTETQAVDVHYQNKWVSKQTSQMKFGYDPDEENRKIEKESEEEEAYKKMKGEIDGAPPDGGVWDLARQVIRSVKKGGGANPPGPDAVGPDNIPGEK